MTIKRSFLLSLAYIAFLVGIDSLIVSPLIPEMARDVSFSPELGGLLVTSYSICYAFAAPLFGPISDQLGRKKIMTWGIMIFAIGTLLTGILPTFTLILLSRAITGIGGAMLTPNVFAMVGDVVPYEQRGRALSIVMGTMVGSSILGVYLGSLLAEFTSWKAVFWIISFLSFGGLWVIHSIVPNKPKKEIAHGSILSTYFQQFREALSSSSVFFGLFANFLWNAGLHGMYTYLGLFYTTRYHLSLKTVGLLFLLSGLSTVIGNLIGGRLADRFGKKTMVGFSGVFCAIGVFSLSINTSIFPLAILSQLIWGLFFGIGQPALGAIKSELAPKQRATVMALSSSAMYLGMTVATSISAMILPSYSFFGVGLFSSLCILCVVPIVYFFISEKTQIHKDKSEAL